MTPATIYMQVTWTGLVVFGAVIALALIGLATLVVLAVKAARGLRRRPLA